MSNAAWNIIGWGLATPISHERAKPETRAKPERGDMRAEIDVEVAHDDDLPIVFCQRSADLDDPSG